MKWYTRSKLCWILISGPDPWRDNCGNCVIWSSDQVAKRFSIYSLISFLLHAFEYWELLRFILWFESPSALRVQNILCIWLGRYLTKSTLSSYSGMNCRFQSLIDQRALGPPSKVSFFFIALFIPCSMLRYTYSRCVTMHHIALITFIGFPASTFSVWFFFSGAINRRHCNVLFLLFDQSLSVHWTIS